MVYKSIEFSNDAKGQKQKIKKIYQMKNDGWSVDREDIVSNNFSPCKAMLCWLVCFPLMVFGYQKGKVIVTFIR